MKITGWILVILGSLSLIGGLISPTPNAGGLVFIVIGAYCLHIANRRKKEKAEKEDFEKWSKSDNKQNT